MYYNIIWCTKTKYKFYGIMSTNRSEDFPSREPKENSLRLLLQPAQIICIIRLQVSEFMCYGNIKIVEIVFDAVATAETVLYTSQVLVSSQIERNFMRNYSNMATREKSINPRDARMLDV